MNRAILMLAATVAVFTFGLAAEAAECGRRDKVIKFLAANFDETRRAVALTNSRPLPLMAELFVSDAGTWTLTLTNPHGITCLRASGHNWESVQDAPAFIGPHSF